MSALTAKHLPGYQVFLEEITTHIRTVRMRIVQAANKETISLYWWLGERIVQNQKQHSWGKSIVEKLSLDLRHHFPEAKFGFSPRNLWDMRRFYLEYKDNPKLRRLVAELPWSQNLLILGKIKDNEERLYYMTATKKQAWTRDTLNAQINLKAYQRHVLANKTHNFEATLPQQLAEQADASMKDIYMLDMLGITEHVVEAEIERRMVRKIKDVILELGLGFSFIGNQYRIVTPDSEVFIDLLFYNRKLQSLVALEIKRSRFKPEHAGKMNFYLNLLDEFVKEPHENPSIGIILCGEHSKFDVEYALRGIDKPVGVAGYQLTRDLPEKLKGVLPNADELEEKILFELGLGKNN
ncbi:MAG: PDDEXK nuclease domain-containing protein [Pseudomonadota bacterium]